MSRAALTELVLLRHAEARPAAPGQSDDARALSAVGMDEARRAGAWLQAHAGVPERVLCSPALRTQQTLAQIMAGAGDWPQPVFEPRIYEATLGTLRQLLQEHAQVGRLWLIGHNPGLQQLSDFMTGRALAHGLPTAGIVLFRSTAVGALDADPAREVLQWAP